MKKLTANISIAIAGFFFHGCCFCDNPTITDTIEQPILTFAVAGHVYGNPETYTHSLYPSFLKKLKADQDKFHFDYLFLTGDVIWDTAAPTWSFTKSQLDSLKIPWYIAPGNHDLVLEKFNESSKKDACSVTYFSSDKNGFLVLNTNNPGWTISNFDQDTLQELSDGFDTLKNLFVFTHQLWWEQNPPSEFKLDSIRPNSFTFYTGKSNFWQDAFPYFTNTNANIYFFAGDMGAWSVLPSYYEDHYKRYHFFGSGMGGGVLDNYLVVSIYQNGRVEIQKRKF